ncbi:MAG: 50S ribosomal protein L23 [Candidatus Micrarchaeia archaeon]|jgi:large subunit ribosomal protein L23
MSKLMYPIATEKAINMVERNNIITYVVDMRATKKEIKEEFEKEFNVKVDKVSIIREPANRKKAYIKLNPQYKASDIALKLKLI